IQFGRLLLEEVVDLRVAAIGIGTALDDEGGETGRGIAEGAARALDDILKPLVAVRLEKSRSFKRAKLGADARRPEIVDHCLAEVCPGRIGFIAPIRAAIMVEPDRHLGESRWLTAGGRSSDRNGRAFIPAVRRRTR